MKKLAYLVVCSFGVSVSYADCLDSFLPAFNNNSISIEGVKGKYKISDTSGKIKTKCTVSPKVLEKFVSKNMIRYSSDKSIVASWNYLAINKQPIYDYLKSLKDNGSDDFEDTSSYTLYGVVNNSFACYKYNYNSFVAGTAHPNFGIYYSCSLPNQKEISITQVINQKDIVNAIVRNKDIAVILKQLNVKPTSIRTLDQIYNVLSKNDDMSCALGSSGMPSSFAITNINSDGSINAIYYLGNNAPHVCQQVAPEVVIKNVKPLMSINSFTKPSMLTK